MNKNKRTATRAEMLRTKLRGGDFPIGGHVFFTDPAISEALAYSGYDFIWIDAEHGPFDKNTLLQHIVAANGAGAAAIVRIAENDSALVKPILEMGVDGIIFPNIMNKEETQKAVRSCLYPPEGIRGFGPRRAVQYGAVEIADYLQYADDSILKIVQIEHRSAVECIAEILGVARLDAVIIGPNDLSASLGLLGNPLHEAVLEQAKKVIAEGKKHRIPVGVSIGPDKKAIDLWKSLDVDFISCGDDISFIHAGAKSALEYMRKK